MFPVLVVFPKALKENVAAWLMVGAPSERIKVVEEPLTIEVPIEVEGFAAVGMVPVAHVGHAITFEPDHVIGDVALIEPFESPPPDGAAATHDEPFEVRTHVEVAAVAIGRYDVFVKAFVPSAVVVAVPPFAVPRTVPAWSFPVALVARKGEEVTFLSVMSPFTSSVEEGFVVPMPTLPLK
jgi:hypothetical protein